MKLKYKKIVLMISIGTICIGGIAFTSMNRARSGKNDVETVQEVAVTDSSFKSATYDTEEGKIVLEKNAYPEINELVSEYLDARAKCDMDKLGTLVSDIANISEEQLKSLSEYIEGYQNIDCYTAAGPEEESYVVLVYSDIKLKDIKTAAPGLTGLYVTKDSNGNNVIYTGVASEEQTSYQEAVYECKGVKELIAYIEKKYQEALDSDADLKAFYTQSQEEAAEEPEVSASPETTNEAK